MNKFEEKELTDFVKQKKYNPLVSQIYQGSYTFCIPKKSLINKSNSQKKRVIYSFNQDENIILKLLVYILKEYDSSFSKNCYAFRTGMTVKKAFYDLVKIKDIDKYYAYKLDIKNYFNSIDVDILLPILKEFLNDEKIYELFEKILKADLCIHNDRILIEKRGAMAGTPFSTFLANVYLHSLDKYFEENNLIYARYSDDIIVFSKSLDELQSQINFIHNELKKFNLDINNEKEFLFYPNTSWNFLGFKYKNKEIDLSEITLKKIKAKIRRKARAIYRWKIQKNKTTEHAIKVMLRVFNNKFYREKNTKDLTWSKWFFPVITTHKSLKIIDEYFISYLRYLSTGRFTKKNFNITYEKLKSLGFRSLVHEYYLFIENNKNK